MNRIGGKVLLLILLVAGTPLPIRADSGSPHGSANPHQRSHAAMDLARLPSVVNGPPAASIEPCASFGQSVECDEQKIQQLQSAAASAYKSLFFDNNFDYLCDPCYRDWHLGESLKQRSIGSWVRYDVGGEYRARHHAERNFRGRGLSGNDDDFLLHRTRLYMDAEVGPSLRVYLEGIDAVSNYEEFAPRRIEENRSDLLNAFVDGVLLEQSGQKLVARGGRQELLYGDQRLISPLDWGNTRRTFDGAKLLWTTGDWQIDGFWTRPVIVDSKNFDSPDDEQEFYSLYATYKGRPSDALDFYWIGYHDYAADYPLADSLKYQTVGTRWQTQRCGWSTLFEGAYQFGEFGSFDHSAGFFVTGLGRTWDKTAGKPTLWAFYDWASGDEQTGNGFHHLFPLAHYYLGFMDLFARSNLEDLNFRGTVNVSEDVQLLAWWHIFWLQDADDVPYDLRMRPLAAAAGGDDYLGQEIDFTINWQVRPRASVLIGYSHFFTGDWFRTNPSVAGGRDADADFVYTQYTVRF